MRKRVKGAKVLIARRVVRCWQSFLAKMMGEEALEEVPELVYLEHRQAYIRRAKRANAAVLEMIVQPPLPIPFDKHPGYERGVKAFLSSLRSSDLSGWIAGQRKLRVLLPVATGASFATVQLAVVQRIRRVLDHHLGPIPIYPTISFIVVNDNEKPSLPAFEQLRPGPGPRDLRERIWG